MPLQGTRDDRVAPVGVPNGTAREAALGRPRVLVHDFAGHPFQIDLSRSLARRGHEVLHIYCKSYTSGKGRFDDTGDPNLSVLGLPAGDEFARYSPARRVRQEVQYGRRFVRAAAEFRPDVVLACNVPLIAQRVAARWLRRHDVPWVFWLQDLYSAAVRATAEDRAGRAGRAVARSFERMERSLLQEASQVVAITEDFCPVLEGWGVPPANRHVVENWAPLEDLPPRPRDNPWRREQGLGDRFVFLYTGTLGLKHRPELLYDLAAQHRDDAEVVVMSEGMGEQHLRRMLAEDPLPNLRLLPFQPFDRYPDIVGAADVLVALLEPSAGRFSVPSKVLSYLCAGRPILGAIPPENLAARTIERAGAGSVIPPTDGEAFLLAAKHLRADADRREDAAGRGRAYAEAMFDTELITDRFTGIIRGALGQEDVVVLP